MNVYIVMSGERYEGGHIYGVFADLQLARSKAKDMMDSWRDGWEKSALGCDTWEAGCDWITIEKRVVYNT
jgi:hypothetical protein